MTDAVSIGRKLVSITLVGAGLFLSAEFLAAQDQKPDDREFVQLSHVTDNTSGGAEAGGTR